MNFDTGKVGGGLRVSKAASHPLNMGPKDRVKGSSLENG